ncbi:Sad1/UNC family protein [Besnoitia besnoiti]|uniref:Sad1/UNC family protein n=1 Tax=Besnoitia besnoiti TaxID=94643 RepID=A0A2A9MMA6_BESBE|nr:Sad1/UNC family protein [Besnoitia besnoiti]PFH36887.1 Sad1/UNC family protein [Besnoitia besnoiti]
MRAAGSEGGCHISRKGAAWKSAHTRRLEEVKTSALCRSGHIVAATFFQISVQKDRGAGFASCAVASKPADSPQDCLSPSSPSMRLRGSRCPFAWRPSGASPSLREPSGGGSLQQRFAASPSAYPPVSPESSYEAAALVSARLDPVCLLSRLSSVCRQSLSACSSSASSPSAAFRRRGRPHSSAKGTAALRSCSTPCAAVDLAGSFSPPGSMKLSNVFEGRWRLARRPRRGGRRGLSGAVFSGAAVVGSGDGFVSPPPQAALLRPRSASACGPSPLSVASSLPRLRLQSFRRMRRPAGPPQEDAAAASRRSCFRLCSSSYPAPHSGAVFSSLPLRRSLSSSLSSVFESTRSEFSSAPSPLCLSRAPAGASAGASSANRRSLRCASRSLRRIRPQGALGAETPKAKRRKKRKEGSESKRREAEEATAAFKLKDGSLGLARTNASAAQVQQLLPLALSRPPLPPSSVAVSKRLFARGLRSSPFCSPLPLSAFLSFSLFRPELTGRFGTKAEARGRSLLSRLSLIYLLFLSLLCLPSSLHLVYTPPGGSPAHALSLVAATRSPGPPTAVEETAGGGAGAAARARLLVEAPLDAAERSEASPSARAREQHLETGRDRADRPRAEEGGEGIQKSEGGSTGMARPPGDRNASGPTAPLPAPGSSLSPESSPAQTEDGGGDSKTEEEEEAASRKAKGHASEAPGGGTGSQEEAGVPGSCERLENGELGAEGDAGKPAADLSARGAKEAPREANSGEGAGAAPRASGQESAGKEKEGGTQDGRVARDADTGATEGGLAEDVERDAEGGTGDPREVSRETGETERPEREKSQRGEKSAKQAPGGAAGSAKVNTSASGTETESRERGKDASSSLELPSTAGASGEAEAAAARAFLVMEGSASRGLEGDEAVKPQEELRVQSSGALTPGSAASSSAEPQAQVRASGQTDDAGGREAAGQQKQRGAPGCREMLDEGLSQNSAPGRSKEAPDDSPPSSSVVTVQFPLALSSCSPPSSPAAADGAAEGAGREVLSPCAAFSPPAPWPSQPTSPKSDSSLSAPAPGVACAVEAESECSVSSLVARSLAALAAPRKRPGRAGAGPGRAASGDEGGSEGDSEAREDATGGERRLFSRVFGLIASLSSLLPSARPRASASPARASQLGAATAASSLPPSRSRASSRSRLAPLLSSAHSASLSPLPPSPADGARQAGAASRRAAAARALGGPSPREPSAASGAPSAAVLSTSSAFSRGSEGGAGAPSGCALRPCSLQSGEEDVRERLPAADSCALASGCIGRRSRAMHQGEAPARPTLSRRGGYQARWVSPLSSGCPNRFRDASGAASPFAAATLQSLFSPACECDVTGHRLRAAGETEPADAEDTEEVCVVRRQPEEEDLFLPFSLSCAGPSSTSEEPRVQLGGEAEAHSQQAGLSSAVSKGAPLAGEEVARESGEAAEAPPGAETRLRLHVRRARESDETLTPSLPLRYLLPVSLQRAFLSRRGRVSDADRAARRDGGGDRPVAGEKVDEPRAAQSRVDEALRRHSEGAEDGVADDAGGVASFARSERAEKETPPVSRGGDGEQGVPAGAPVGDSQSLDAASEAAGGSGGLPASPSTPAGPERAAAPSRRPAPAKPQEPFLNGRPFLRGRPYEAEAQKLKFDFASLDAGARVVASSRGVANIKAVQRNDLDSYMLVPCSLHPKFFVLSFTEPIHVEQVALASMEIYASAFRHIQLLGSDSYPTKQWKLLANLETNPEEAQEIFDVKKICATLHDGQACWAKYLKVRLLSHHVVESPYYYCSLTSFHVFGSTGFQMLESHIHSEEGPDDEKPRPEEGDAPGEAGEEDSEDGAEARGVAGERALRAAAPASTAQTANALKGGRRGGGGGGGGDGGDEGEQVEAQEGRREDPEGRQSGERAAQGGEGGARAGRGDSEAEETREADGREESGEGEAGWHAADMQPGQSPAAAAAGARGGGVPPSSPEARQETPDGGGEAEASSGPGGEKLSRGSDGQLPQSRGKAGRSTSPSAEGEEGVRVDASAPAAPSLAAWNPAEGRKESERAAPETGAAHSVCSDDHSEGGDACVERAASSAAGGGALGARDAAPRRAAPDEQGAGCRGTGSRREEDGQGHQGASAETGRRQTERGRERQAETGTRLGPADSTLSHAETRRPREDSPGEARLPPSLREASAGARGVATDSGRTAERAEAAAAPALALGALRTASGDALPIEKRALGDRRDDGRQGQARVEGGAARRKSEETEASCAAHPHTQHRAGDSGTRAVAGGTFPGEANDEKGEERKKPGREDGEGRPTPARFRIDPYAPLPDGKAKQHAPVSPAAAPSTSRSRGEGVEIGGRVRATRAAPEAPGLDEGSSPAASAGASKPSSASCSPPSWEGGGAAPAQDEGEREDDQGLLRQLHQWRDIARLPLLFAPSTPGSLGAAAPGVPTHASLLRTVFNFLFPSGGPFEARGPPALAFPAPAVFTSPFPSQARTEDLEPALGEGVQGRESENAAKEAGEALRREAGRQEGATARAAPVEASALRSLKDAPRKREDERRDDVEREGPEEKARGREAAGELREPGSALPSTRRPSFLPSFHARATSAGAAGAGDEGGLAPAERRFSYFLERLFRRHLPSLAHAGSHGSPSAPASPVSDVGPPSDARVPSAFRRSPAAFTPTAQFASFAASSLPHNTIFEDLLAWTDRERRELPFSPGEGDAAPASGADSAPPLPSLPWRGGSRQTAEGLPAQDAREGAQALTQAVPSAVARSKASQGSRGGEGGAANTLAARGDILVQHGQQDLLLLLMQNLPAAAAAASAKLFPAGAPLLARGVAESPVADLASAPAASPSAPPPKSASTGSGSAAGSGRGAVKAALASAASHAGDKPGAPSAAKESVPSASGTKGSGHVLLTLVDRMKAAESQGAQIRAKISELALSIHSNQQQILQQAVLLQLIQELVAFLYIRLSKFDVIVPRLPFLVDFCDSGAAAAAALAAKRAALQRVSSPATAVGAHERSCARDGLGLFQAEKCPARDTARSLLWGEEEADAGDGGFFDRVSVGGSGSLQGRGGEDGGACGGQRQRGQSGGAHAWGAKGRRSRVGREGGRRVWGVHRRGKDGQAGKRSWDELHSLEKDAGRGDGSGCVDVGGSPFAPEEDEATLWAFLFGFAAWGLTALGSSLRFLAQETCFVLLAPLVDAASSSALPSPHSAAATPSPGRLFCLRTTELGAGLLGLLAAVQQRLAAVVAQSVPHAGSIWRHVWGVFPSSGFWTEDGPRVLSLLLLVLLLHTMCGLLILRFFSSKAREAAARAAAAVRECQELRSSLDRLLRMPPPREGLGLLQTVADTPAGTANAAEAAWKSGAGGETREEATEESAAAADRKRTGLLVAAQRRAAAEGTGGRGAAKGRQGEDQETGNERLPSHAARRDSPSGPCELCVAQIQPTPGAEKLSGAYERFELASSALKREGVRLGSRKRNGDPRRRSVDVLLSPVLPASPPSFLPAFRKAERDRLAAVPRRLSSPVEERRNGALLPHTAALRALPAAARAPRMALNLSQCLPASSESLASEFTVRSSSSASRSAGGGSSSLALACAGGLQRAGQREIRGPSLPQGAQARGEAGAAPHAGAIRNAGKWRGDTLTALPSALASFDGREKAAPDAARASTADAACGNGAAALRRRGSLLSSKHAVALEEEGRGDAAVERVDGRLASPSDGDLAQSPFSVAPSHVVVASAAVPRRPGEASGGFGGVSCRIAERRSEGEVAERKSEARERRDETSAEDRVPQRKLYQGRAHGSRKAFKLQRHTLKGGAGSGGLSGAMTTTAASSQPASFGPSAKATPGGLGQSKGVTSSFVDEAPNSRPPAG